MTTSTVGSTDETVRVPPRHPWRQLLWTWFVFWLLLLMLGAQEYQWSGGTQFWRPLERPPDRS